MPDGANIVVGGSAAPAAAANSVLGNPTGAVATASSISHTGAARTFCALNSLAAQQAYLAIPAAVSYPIPVSQGGTGATDAATARNNLGLGTAAQYNIGTSGATVPLCNSQNTYNLLQWFQGASVHYGGYVVNNYKFYFQGNPSNGTRDAWFTMQSDNNFVCYSHNAAGTQEARWAVNSGVDSAPINLWFSGIKAYNLSDPGIGSAHFNRMWLSGLEVKPHTKVYDSPIPAGGSYINIPAGTLRIMILFWYVQVNNGNPIVVQLGDAEGIEGSGYEARCYYGHNGNNWSNINVSYGFPVGHAGGAVVWYSGIMTIQHLIGAQHLLMSCQGLSNQTTTSIIGAEGIKGTSLTLTHLLITVSGASFTSGHVCVWCEQ